MKRSKMHYTYRNAAGDRLPSVSGLTGMIDKPALVWAAWDLGIKGLDYKKEWAIQAGIGTIAHYLIQCQHSGEEPDLKGYAPEDVDKAENAFLGFLDWEKKYQVEKILSEKQFVSEKYQFGGTIDFYGKVDGQFALVDYKTNKDKRVFPENLVQLAAYRLLLRENGHDVDMVHLLSIDKKDGSFAHHTYEDLESEQDAIIKLAAFYPTWKKVWK